MRLSRGHEGAADCAGAPGQRRTCRNLSLTSLMSTSMPASALAVAMPEPMRPPPSTATFRIFLGFRPASVMPFTCSRGAATSSQNAGHSTQGQLLKGVDLICCVGARWNETRSGDVTVPSHTEADACTISSRCFKAERYAFPFHVSHMRTRTQEH